MNVSKGTEYMLEHSQVKVAELGIFANSSHLGSLIRRGMLGAVEQDNV